MPSFRFQSIATSELFPASFLLCVSLALHTKLFFIVENYIFSTHL